MPLLWNSPWQSSIESKQLQLHLFFWTTFYGWPEVRQFIICFFKIKELLCEDDQLKSGSYKKSMVYLTSNEIKVVLEFYQCMY